MGRLTSIQILRFLAALMVVQFHATGVIWDAKLPHPDLMSPGAFDRFGQFGVDIFFVISGFIMGRIVFVDQREDTAQFVRARLVRIVPLYWLLSIPWLVLPRVDGPLTPTVIATSLTFWPAWNVMTKPTSGVGWTLCFEMLFYAALAVVLWAKRSRQAVLAVVLVFLGALAFRRVTPAPWAAFLGNLMILEFLAGLLIAVLWRKRRPIVGAVALLAGVGFGMVTTHALAGFPQSEVEAYAGVGDLTRVVFIGPAAALIVWGALQFQPRGRVAGVLGYLGDASYALYLSHPLVLLGILQIAPRLGLSSDAVMAGSMLACVIVGCAVHEWLEKPILAALRRPSPRLALA